MFRVAVVAVLLGWGSAYAELADPMRPPQGSSTKPPVAKRTPTYWLSSTVVANDRRVAVINGRRVGVGDRIGSARVIEILPTEVILQRQGNRIALRLLPVSVKTPVRNGAR